MFTSTNLPFCSCVATGKSRKLYLPSGLLSLETDVPSYMNGTLAGE